MLEIILMLLGLALPNSSVNTETNTDENPITVVQTNNEDSGGIGGQTGGSNGQKPPTNP